MSTLTKILSKNWIRSVSNLAVSNGNLHVKLEKKEEKFPLVWLRDNCQCDECFHRESQSRVIIWHNPEPDCKVKRFEAKNDKVLIEWKDGHGSTFSEDWLKKRSFNPRERDSYLRDWYKPERKTWGKKDFQGVLKTFSFGDVMSDDGEFFRYLEALAERGVVLLDGAPRDLDTCRKLSERIAFRRKTHYGEDFHVISKPSTSNVAYVSGLFLQLHTDLPYYHYKPGIILLTCLEQTKGSGGESLLCDTFYAAERLREHDKEKFDILTEIEVDWSDIGHEDGIKFHKIHRAPVISVDKKGKIEMIRYSTPQRDSHFSVDLDKVEPWYKALRTFIGLILEETVQLKLKPGQILGFDNTRLLHGRLKYEDTPDAVRHLVGNYVDWDEIYSKWRVLKAELNK